MRTYVCVSKDAFGERNPGCVKFPCIWCCKAEEQNDQAIQCDRCENWSHAICCGISHKQYQLHLKLGDTGEWLCLHSIGPPICTINESLSTLYPSHVSSSLLNVSNGIARHHGLLQCCSMNARSVMNKKLNILAL